MSDTPALRASDADRERTVELLRDHAVEGRLSLEEFSDRMSAAYLARTNDDRPATEAKLRALSEEADAESVLSKPRFEAASAGCASDPTSPLTETAGELRSIVRDGRERGASSGSS